MDKSVYWRDVFATRPVLRLLIIEKICSACEKDGVPQPVYTITPGDIMIKFTAPEDRGIRVTEGVTVKVTDKVTNKGGRCIDLVGRRPRLYYATTGRTVKRQPKEQKDAGLTECVGSDRKGYCKLLK